MVRAQIQREEARRELDQEDFLSSLGISMKFIEIDSTTHPRFARAMELINKTNQYNTTGKRWTHDQFHSAFADGHRIMAFDVSDRYTNYGLVGVVVVDRNTIEQFVMSCRVMGMEIENAIIAHTSRLIRAGADTDVTGLLVETARNMPCLDVFKKCGFENAGDAWLLERESGIEVPRHIEISVDA